MAIQTKELAILEPTTTSNQFVGRKVAIDGDILVLVGETNKAFVYEHDDNSTPTDPFDDQWTKIAELTPSYNDIESVAIEGNTIVAGGRTYGHSGKTNCGALFVFVKPSGGWANATEADGILTASDPADEDGLGGSVAINGTTIVGGAPNLGALTAPNGGAAYVFEEPQFALPSGNRFNFGSLVPFFVGNGATPQDPGIVEVDDNKFVICYAYSTKGVSKVGTIDSNGNVTLGSEDIFEPSIRTSWHKLTKIDTDKVMLMYRAGSPNIQGRIGTISGTTVTWGNETQINPSGTTPWSLSRERAIKISENKVAITWTKVVGSTRTGRVVAATISGTAISVGTDVNTGVNPWIFADIDVLETDKFAIAYTKLPTVKGIVQIGSVSGTTVTLGSASAELTYGDAHDLACIDSNTIVTVRDNDSAGNKATCHLLTVSGLTTTLQQTSAAFGDAVGSYRISKFGTSGFIVVGGSEANTKKGWAIKGEVSGTTMSFGPQVTFSNYGLHAWDLTIFGNTRMAVAWEDQSLGHDPSRYMGYLRVGSLPFLGQSSGWQDRTQDQKLVGSDITNRDIFGTAVAIDNDQIIAGAPNKGVNTGGFLHGAAYVFTKSGGSFSQAQRLLPTNTGRSNMFGLDVDIVGDVAGVISKHDLNDVGAVYIYRKSGVSFAEEQKISSETDHMHSLAIDVSSGVIIAGSQAENTIGAAHLIRGVSGVWTDELKFVPSDTTTNAIQFGCDVAVEGDFAIVGARLHDHSTSGADQGAAYVCYTGFQPDAEGIVEGLITTVAGYGLGAGLANALTKKLEHVLRVMTDTKADKLVGLVGVNVLYAFINHCEAQSGRGLTADQANALIAEAETAITLILET